MSGEKKFKGTERRRQQGREKGQVLKSTELSSGLIFFGMFILLKYWLPSAATEILHFYKLSLQRLPVEFTVSSLTLVINETVLVVFKVVGPVAIGGVLLGLIVNFLQVGSLFTTKPLVADFERINPITGLKRLFSVRTLFELIKSVLKLVVMGYLLYSTLINNVQPHLNEIQLSPLYKGMGIIGQALLTLCWKATLFFVLLGIGDYLYQWWEYEKSIRMSHEEYKEEMKSIEGDPYIKGEIKRKQKEMAMRRMMQQVPQADVVIVNPTHYAVAVRYDTQTMQAPVVVAKGQDEVAKRIKAIAEENKVPLVENPPLARGLYRSVELGQPVPPELYRALAEVLALVYRLNRRRIS